MLGISPGTLIAFLVTALVVIAIPGPSVLFVVSRALAHGRRVALWSMLGNTAGVFVLVIVVALGMGVIAERSLVLFTILKPAGGLYLVYMGVKTFRERRTLAAVLETVSVRTSDRRAFRDGLLVGVGNPKVMVFMAAVLPQFVAPAAGQVSLQILLLGFLFCLVAIVSDGTWVMAVGSARTWFTRTPRRLELVGGARGMAIAMVGASLLVLGRES